MDVTRAYAALGVSNAATWDDLRRAYRLRLQSVHPDTGNGDVRQLHSITEAFRHLRETRAAEPGRAGRTTRTTRTSHTTRASAPAATERPGVREAGTVGYASTLREHPAQTTGLLVDVYA